MYRVDFHSRYSSTPGEPPDHPGQPLVQLVLVNGKRHFQAFGMLDTGSTWTIVGTQFADSLKLDYKTAPSFPIVGIGGTRSMGQLVDVKLVLIPAKYAWMAKVAVSPAVDAFPFILLGHIGFFDRFDVTFETRHRHFHIRTEKPSNA